MVFAIVLLALLALPPALLVGMVAKEELEWQEFKRKTGIR